MGTVIIRRAEEADIESWHRLRLALWPDATQLADEQEMQEYLLSDARAVFVARANYGHLVGFLEASIRYYADGCTTHNVGYIEGWYVDEEYRRQGIGVALAQAAEAWARSRGCREMASDCLLENEVSLAAHLALGYKEKESLIHFAKTL